MIMKRLLLSIAFIFAIVFGVNIANAVSNKIDGTFDKNRILVKSKSEYLNTVKMVCGVSFDESLQRMGTDAAKLNQLLQSINANSFKSRSSINKGELAKWFEITLDSVTNFDRLQSQLLSTNLFEAVEQIPIYKQFLSPPNDPNYVDLPTTPSQWGLFKVNANGAWAAHTGANNVVIAVIDDGVRTTHSDIAPNVWINPYEIAGNGIDDDGNGKIDDINGWDASDNDNNPSTTVFGHGTHCAGIAMAATNNNKGVAALAYNTAKLMTVKSKKSATAPNLILDNTLGGMEYVVETYAQHLSLFGANYRMVVSMSFGGPGYSLYIDDLIKHGKSMGIVWVAAAGNDNVETKMYPAAYDDVIAVAASDPNDAKASFSNYGDWVDVSAPGTSIYSTSVNGDNLYEFKQGTSMACPMVASLAALLLANNNTLYPDQVRNCILTGSDNHYSVPANVAYAGKLGTGRINALNTISCSPPIGSITDAEMVSILTPGVTICNTNVTASFLLGNAGSTVIDSVEISYQWDNGIVNTQNVIGTIALGGSVLVGPINQTLSYGEHTLKVWTSNPNGIADATPLNDTLTHRFAVRGFAYFVTPSTPFVENFEIDFASNEWFVENPDGLNTWELATTAGNPTGGSKSARIDIDNNRYYRGQFTSRKQDGLISKPIGISATGNTTLSFRHAYRSVNGRNDGLAVLVSTDCGLTFPYTVYYGEGNNTNRRFDFATNSDITTNFIPTTNSDWAQTSSTSQYATLQNGISLNGFKGQIIVLKFVAYNDGGHSIYLDDIRISNVVETPTCHLDGDTINQFTGTKSVFGSHPNFNFGTNTSGNLTFAERFDPSPSYNMVYGARFELANNGSPAPAATDFIVATLYTNTGTNGGPGTVLATKTIMLTDFWAGFVSNRVTITSYFDVPQAVVSPYYIGLQIPATNTASLGLISNNLTIPESVMPMAAWVRQLDGGWTTARYVAGNRVNLAIFPIASHTSATLVRPSAITGTTSPCVGSATTYSVTNVAGVTYEWLLPANLSGTSTTNSIAITPSNTTAGTIMVRTVSGSCTSHWRSLTVNPVASPSQPSAITIGGGSDCQGEVRLFSVTNVVGLTYQWILPSDWSGNSATNSIDVTLGLASGSVSVIATNANGCQSPVRTSSVISPAPGSGVPPTISSISGNTTVCLGSTQTYEISSVFGASYSWSVPTGWVITSGQGTEIIEVTVGSALGNISVTVSEGSCTPTTTEVLTIDAIVTPPTSILSGFSQSCSGTNDGYKVATVAGATGYTWALPAGWAVVNGQGTDTITFTPDNTDGTVSVVANGPGGCATSALTFNVTSLDMPGAITGNASICESAIEEYSVLPVTDAAGYFWNVPSGWGGTQNQFEVTLQPDATSGTIAVAAHNNRCITFGSALAVTVSAKPASPTGAIPSVVCEGTGNTQYAVDPILGATFNWTFPAGWSITANANTENPTVTIGSVGGTILISATVGGCTSDLVGASVSVSSLGNPGAITGPTNVCRNDATVLGYKIGGVAGATAYNWVFPANWGYVNGQGTDSINVVATATAPAADPGNVICQVTNGVCIKESTLAVGVSGTTPSQPSTITGNTPVCSGTSQVYSVTNVSGMTYNWTLPTGWAITSGAGTNIITVTVGTGSANISVTAKNSGGCVSSARNRAVAANIGATPADISLSGGSIPACPGQTRTFSTSASGSPFFDWSLPLGWTLNSGAGTNTISVTTGATAGNITVKTRHTSCATSTGESITKSYAVTANPAPDKPGDIVGPDKFCSGNVYSYSVPAVAGATTYSWTVPSGWVINTGAGTNAITTTAGGTNGNITVAAGNGTCLSNASSLAVTQIAAPGSGPNYLVTSASNTYTNLSGATNAIGANSHVDGVVSATVPIGFTFNFTGTDFTDIKISSYGYITFNTAHTTAQISNGIFGEFGSASGMNDAIGADPTIGPFFAPFWAIMRTASTGAVRYKTTGSAPNRVFSIEYLNMLISQSGTFSSSTPTLSFTVNFYETTNEIKVNYKRESGTPDFEFMNFLGFPFYANGEIGMANSSGWLVLDDYENNPTQKVTGTTSVAFEPVVVTTTDNEARPANNFQYTFTPLGAAVDAPNDVCASAISLTALSYGECALSALTAYDARGADNVGSPATPACWTGTGSKSGDVWFSVNKAAGVKGLNISTDFAVACAPSGGTAIEVYTGTCASLTPVSGSCAENNGTVNANSASTYLTGLPDAATTYYIRLANDADELDKFSICVETQPIDCSNPMVALTSADIPYSNSSFTFCGAGNAYTASTKPSCAGSSVGWNTQEEQVVTITTTSANEKYNIKLYNNSFGCQSTTNCGRDRYELFVLDKCPSDAAYNPTSSCIAYTTDNGGGTAPGNGINVTFPTAGTYYIIMNHDDGNDYCNDFNDFPYFQITPVVEPAVPSSCSNPIVINSLPYTHTSTTCGAGDDHRGSGTPPNASFPDLVEYSSQWTNVEEAVYRFNKETAGTQWLNIDVTGLNGKPFSIALFGPYASNAECPASATVAPTKQIAWSNATMDNTAYHRLINAELSDPGYYYVYIQRQQSNPCDAYTLKIEWAPDLCGSEVISAIAQVPDMGVSSTGVLSTCGRANSWDVLTPSTTCGGTEYYVKQPGGIKYCGNTQAQCTGSPFMGYAPDAVFTYSPTVTQRLFVEFGAGSNGFLSIYEGCPRGAFTMCILTGRTDNAVWTQDIQFEAGSTYYFIYTDQTVFPSMTSCGNFEIKLRHTGLPIVEGKTCFSAIEIPSLPFTKSNFNTDGTIDNYGADKSLPGACLYYSIGNNAGGFQFGGGEVGEEMVFKYTPPTNQCIKVTMKNLGDPGAVGSGYGENIRGFYLTEKCPSDSGSQCMGIYNTSGTLNSVVGSYSLQAGNDYYLMVQSNTDNGTCGGVGCPNYADIKIEPCDEVAVNTSPCTAELIGLGDRVYGHNMGATDDGIAKPACWVKDGIDFGTALHAEGENRWGELNPVWYKFVAPAGGNIRLIGQTEIDRGEDMSNDIQTKFQVQLYTMGANCTTLTEVSGTCDDMRIADICRALGSQADPTPLTSAFGFTKSGLSAGTTYYIRIDGIGNNQGRFSFRVIDNGKISCIQDYQDALSAMNVCSPIVQINGGYAGQGLICDMPWYNLAYPPYPADVTAQGNRISNSCFGAQNEKNSIWLKFKTSSLGGAVNFTIKQQTEHQNMMYFALFEGDASGNVNQVDMIKHDYLNVMGNGPAGLPAKVPGNEALRCTQAYSFFDNLTWPDVTPGFSQNWRGLSASEPPAQAKELNSFDDTYNGIVYTLNADPDKWYYLLLMNQWGTGRYPIEVDFTASDPDAIEYNAASQPASLTWTGQVSSDWFTPQNWDTDANPSTPNCFLPDQNTDVVIPSTSGTTCPSSVIYFPTIEDSALVGAAVCKAISLNAANSNNFCQLTLKEGAKLEVYGNFSMANKNSTKLLADPKSLVVFKGGTAQTITYGSSTGGSTPFRTFGCIYVGKSANSVTNSSGQTLFVGGSLKVYESNTFNANNRDISIGGDLINYGTISNFATRRLTFNGTGVTQKFVNTQSSFDVGNITINKTSLGTQPTVVDTLELYSDLILNNSGSVLTFTRGVVKTIGSAELVIRDNGAANAITGYGANSYVVGNLRRKVTTTAIDYDFPVGSATKGYQLARLNFANLSTINTILATFEPVAYATASAVATECLNATFICPPLDNGQWDIKAFNASATQVTDVGTYNITLFPLNYTNPFDYATIMKDGTLAGTPTPNCSALPILTRNGLTGFSEFAIGQAALVPPTPLSRNNIALRAIGEQNQIKLFWSVDRQLKAESFLVYRLDKITNDEWSLIATLKGNTTEWSMHTFNDLSVEKGVTYSYKIVAQNGEQYIESNVASTSLYLDRAFDTKVYPNPSNGLFTIDVKAQFSKSQVSGTLFNSLGQYIKGFDFMVEEYQGNHQLDLSDLPKGIYHLVLLTNQHKRVVKLNIE